MISINIAHEGEAHKKIMSTLRTFIRESRKVHDPRIAKWKKAEETFMGYIPVKEVDALRKVKRDGGEPQYTTIQLPYSYAVAMAAHSYWCSVFLSRSPVFQFMGSNDEGEQQVLALESLVNYQVTKARMLANFFIFFQDVSKYGEAWLSPFWKTDRSRISEIVEEEEMYLGLIKTGKMVKRRKITDIIGYQGNAVHNIHPGKVLTDPRYSRNNFQKGDFVAIQTTLSTNQLLEGEEAQQYINIKHLKKKNKASGAYNDVFDDSVASDVMEKPKSDALETDIHQHIGGVFDVYEFCVNLIPSKWGLGSGKLPEKWIITTDVEFSAIIECRPLGYIHNKFPLALIEIEPEAYMHFSRGLLEIFGPIQETLDWLVNSHFFNVRQTLNTQMIMDPSRVNERDFLGDRPGKLIRLKPAAYGSDVRTAVAQLPVQDVTQGNLNDMAMMYQLGERLGISDPVMGVGNPSSRRTAQEVRGSQAFSVSRLKTISEYFSATGFMDLGSVFVMNSQQFYDGDKKFRIAGDLVTQAGPAFMQITPEMIAGEYGVEPVDGSLPVDRYAQANLWREIITQMAGVPQVIQQYDLGKIFGYVAQLAGIKNLNRFKMEIMPDQAMALAAQSGNAVPASGGNVMEPGQVPGMGTSG